MPSRTHIPARHLRPKHAKTTADIAPLGSDALISKPASADTTAPDAAIKDAVKDVPQDTATHPVDPQQDTPPLSRVRKGAARMNTRLVGIDRSSGTIETFSHLGSNSPQAPGWLLVIAGHGVGNSFRVSQGICTVGLNVENTAQLFYGNVGHISSAYATIFYDKPSGDFFVGNCGNSNTIKRNGTVAQETEPMKNGDRLQFAQTTLRFVAISGS